MFQFLKFDLDRVYPALVVSTMSSGKSTLINALVGTELLPSMNRACTARALAILNNDRKKQFEIHAIDEEGRYSLIKEATKKVVADFNDSNNVVEMIIEGEITGIKNSKKSLMIIDTPGINNSMGINHEKTTKMVLDDYPEGLIIYVINAQQIGTNDDSNFLNYISKKKKDNNNFKLLFILNKMDSIDSEKEDPMQLVDNCKKYIESAEIDNPIIVPVSSSAALLFKRVLNGTMLTEKEEEDFFMYFRRFKRIGFSLQDYIISLERGTLSDSVVVDGENYSRAEIYAALENTGFPFLEKKIDEILVKSLNMRDPKITTK